MGLMRTTVAGALALCPLLAQDALLEWMNRTAQEQLAQREAAIAKILTPADADRRRQWVRSKLLEILGGLPDYRGPLNAHVTGRLTNSHYTLEKVIFESLPHYYVTANLYRPNQPGRYPAVLLSAGHSTHGKTENHRIAANLAAKGFVALAYDPVGLGERVQAYDRRVGRGIAGCCANEHLQAGAQSLLIGQSVARYFIHDAIRGIDYLLSRAEVDRGRVAAAGCSGGGCITTYVAALDPRVKAAAPACFINSLRVLFSGPYPDSEMSLPRFLASGLDHADFLEVAEGTPWLILATEGDYFTPAGVRPVYEEVRRWYRLYGADEKVQLFMGPGPHGTPLETRQALYGWMIRWLQPGGERNARELDVTMYPDHELQVTKSGQVEDEPGSRWLYQVIRDEFRAKKRLGSVSDLLAEAAAAKGNVVFEFEPRDCPAANDKRPYFGNWMTNARAAARDIRGIWLLLAAAVDLRISRVWLDRTPHSLSAAMDGAINANLFDAMIPGFLLHWDLADLVKAMGNRTVLWTDPADWMGRTVPGLGAGFRYRYSDQKDEPYLTEFLQ